MKIIVCLKQGAKERFGYSDQRQGTWIRAVI